MTVNQAEKQALGLFIYALSVFALMQVFAFVSEGAGAQEFHEVFAPPSAYTNGLVNAGGDLRIVLLMDVFFMIGYASALAMITYAGAARNRVMAWVAGLGIAVLLMLDISENMIMVSSLDLAEAGYEIDASRIALQVGISGAKWHISAFTVVALSFTLPSQTALEKLLIWSARILLPLGVGLFVTGAFEVRVVGGLLILSGMAGGFGLLALTIWLRLRANR